MLYERPLERDERLPWLALPPFAAIARCFAGSIAANPRFDPECVAM
jgi:hypothetical protein